MLMGDRVSLKTVSVSLPFGIGSMFWEARQTVAVSPTEYEQSCYEEATTRWELEALRVCLEEYAQALATIAGVEE